MCRFSKSPGEHLAQRNQLVQQGKVTGCVNFKGPSQGLGPAPQGLGLGLGGASSRVWGPRLGRARAAACDQFFVVLKSLGRGLAKGWESAE